MLCYPCVRRAYLHLRSLGNHKPYKTLNGVARPRQPGRLTPPPRAPRRQSGAVSVLILTLVNGQGSVEGPLVDAMLGTLAAVARDDEGRIVIQEAGGIPLIIKLMDGPPESVRHSSKP